METALVPVDPPPPGALLAPGGATAPPAALVYLASLQSEKSRVSMRSCLLRAWRLLDGQGDALLGPWHSLTYADVLALRARLAASGLAPDSCNQTLAAVRGTIKQAWLLGLATHETYERVKQIEPVRGKRIPRGRMLSPVEQAKLLEACDGTHPRRRPGWSAPRRHARHRLSARGDRPAHRRLVRAAGLRGARQPAHAGQGEQGNRGAAAPRFPRRPRRLARSPGA
jgi:hypothetical protein